MEAFVGSTLYIGDAGDPPYCIVCSRRVVPPSGSSCPGCWLGSHFACRHGEPPLDEGELWRCPHCRVRHFIAELALADDERTHLALFIDRQQTVIERLKVLCAQAGVDQCAVDIATHPD